MTSVLITGLGGFLGNAAARNALQKNWTITGIGHKPLTQDLLNFVKHWQQGDVNFKSISQVIEEGGKPDILIHAAGNGKVGESWISPLDDYSNNVLTTAEIIEALRIQSPQSVLVLPSSAAVYGNNLSNSFLETTVGVPISPYGQHKKIAEDLCHGASRFYGIKCVIIRFFSLYGPGLRKQLLWDIFCKLKKNNLLTLSGSATNTRDFLYIDDAVELMFLAASKVEETPLILNGGSGYSISIEKVAKQMIRLISPDTSLSFDDQNRVGDPIKMKADMAKSFNLGFKPKINFSEGVHRYIDWASNIENEI